MTLLVVDRSLLETYPLLETDQQRMRNELSSCIFGWRLLGYHQRPVNTQERPIYTYKRPINTQKRKIDILY